MVGGGYRVLLFGTLLGPEITGLHDGSCSVGACLACSGGGGRVRGLRVLGVGAAGRGGVGVVRVGWEWLWGSLFLVFLRMPCLFLLGGGCGCVGVVG